MLANYLLVALRTFRKNALYASLNLLGLVLGYGSLILMMAYLYHETSFDAFHAQSDRIYRVTHQDHTYGGFEVHWARTHADYVNELSAEIPEIEQLIRFQNHERKYVRVGTEKFRPKHLYSTDSAVFEVFDFDLLAGDEARALAVPYSVVITETLARTYFGEEDPLGKELFVVGTYHDEEVRHVVTGVMKDLPGNTHLPVDMLLSFKNPKERSWWAYVYVLLSPASKIEQVEARLPAFMEKYANNQEQQRTEFVFQPLTSIHLHSNLAREIRPNGNWSYVQLLTAAGLLILLIAIINCYNLSTALALRRGDEMGMRRILGAERWHLTKAMLAESVVYHLLAATLGWGLALGLEPFFQELMQVDGGPPLSWMAVGLPLLAIALGLIMGLPIAWLMTSKLAFPQQSKQGSALGKNGKAFPWMRLLIGLQFAASMGLIASAWIVGNQWAFIRDKNLGMTTDQVLAIPDVPNPVTDAFPTFQTEVSSLSGVVSVAACLEVPSREIRDSGPAFLRGKEEDPENVPMLDIQVISPQFLETMNMKLLAGEDRSDKFVFRPGPQFSETYQPADYFKEQSRNYLINESAMRKLGFESPEEAVGQQMRWSIGGYELAYGPITGVVQDFHQETLKNKVDPTVMMVEPIWFRTFLIKLNTKDIQQTMASIQSKWDELFPAYPMESHFLDELYDRLYHQEQRQLQLLVVLSGLALLISLLGLMSLLAFVLQTCAQEMAIRRVLGAGFQELGWWMGRDYLLMLLAGGALAVPLSYLWVKDWLQNFAYHVPVPWGIYAMTAGLLIILVVAAVGLQTMNGMQRNPAEVLRDQ